MRRSSFIFLYLILSAGNGIVPFTIALLCMVPVVYALLIWGAATLLSFILICLICLRSAIVKTETAPEDKALGAEFKKAIFYR